MNVFDAVRAERVSVPSTFTVYALLSCNPERETGIVTDEADVETHDPGVPDWPGPVTVTLPFKQVEPSQVSPDVARLTLAANEADDEGITHGGPAIELAIVSSGFKATGLYAILSSGPGLLS